MNIWGSVLRLTGWKVEITAPRRDKCVRCVAPHTSNWDFPLGLAAYKSLGREANFLMKKFWFFFPLKYLLRALGGIPVARSPHGYSLVEQVTAMFRERSYMNLAVTPEGTRSLTRKWHTGFLRIAYGAGVPVQLGVIDYRSKRIIIKDELELTGDISKDMEAVKAYYSAWTDAGKFSDKFALPEES